MYARSSIPSNIILFWPFFCYSFWPWLSWLLSRKLRLSRTIIIRLFSQWLITFQKFSKLNTQIQLQFSSDAQKCILGISQSVANNGLVCCLFTFYVQFAWPMQSKQLTFWWIKNEPIYQKWNFAIISITTKATET